MAMHTIYKAYIRPEKWYVYVLHLLDPEDLPLDFMVIIPHGPMDEEMRFHPMKQEKIKNWSNGLLNVDT